MTDWFAGLTASLRSLVEGAGLLVRRTLFNKAPTMDPVQTGGQVQGLVTGTIGGVDPEGDPIAYSVTQAPRYGSVALNADGSYTYTPGSGFAGVDSFGVAATDTGLYVDLLDLLRPGSTQALVEVSQSAAEPRLTFNFVFGSGSQLWSTDARNALLSAARDMASYLVVAQPVSITYDVTGRYSPFGSTLATAGSDLVSSDPGFFDTVVQQKIISGVDANGSAPDGQIDWNFFYPWAFGDSVGTGQYDLRATAMHELTHSLGFLSVVGGPGSNTGRNWTAYDGFVVDANGIHPIGGEFAWDAGYDANLTGGGGGLYFGGTHAVAAYGGLVPLYTPNPWTSGSSMSHLARSAGTGSRATLMYSMMDTGLGTRTFSPVERGILQDLGYTVVPAPQTYALLFVGLAFVRRRKRCR